MRGKILYLCCLILQLCQAVMLLYFNTTGSLLCYITTGFLVVIKYNLFLLS